MRHAFIALAFTLLAGSAQAASFDCAKARTAVEKRICAELWLSTADSAMAVAYAQAMAATPTPLTLKAEQQTWLKERDKVDDLDAAITGRGNELTARTLADRRMRRPIPITALASRCAPLFDVGQCTVKKSGKVAGASRLLWQLLDGQEEKSGSVVLEAQSGEAAAIPLVWTQDVGVRYDAPKVVRSPDGDLLVLGGAMSGRNAEVVFQRTGRGRWAQIDTQGWLARLPARLPQGMGVWKGVFPDYEAFTATSALWKDSDANCCPTGGFVAVKLRLVGDRLVIDSAKVTLGEDAARGE